jgi:hypothetical protein
MEHETFIIEPTDKILWNKFLNTIPDDKKDIYYLADYVNLYKNKVCEPKCFIYKSKDNIFFYPFIKRSILKTKYYDLITPYGYGGAIMKNNDSEFTLSALKNLTNYINENNIISEQIKFHPLLKNYEIYKKTNSHKIYMACNTVTIDCANEINFMWSKIYKKSNKEKIKKIQNKKAKIFFSNNKSSIIKFREIYNNNLKNINAKKKYYFELEYYYSFLNNLNNNFFIAHLEIENEILASQLVIYDKNYGHTHLQGTSIKGKKLGVTNLLKHEVIMKAKEMKLKYLHFGGGRTDDENDSLLKFKKGFSNTLSEFFIAEKIYNNNIYNDLIIDTNDKMFYSYRNDNFIT